MQAFRAYAGLYPAGLAEIEVAAELEYQARLLGAEGMSFETIVASGVRSALPHGRATEARCRAGIPDARLRYNPRRLLLGYDPYRVPGKAKGKERSGIPGSAGSAGGGAVAAVGPGASCGAVDEAARGVLRKAGLAEAFSHSTGHGVGLEIHESPRIGAGQTAKLLAGMV
jgi:Xaa-Pro aminopeptidase